ncbi:MAG: hypothetical protein RDU41_05935 [Clostridia bacterium]|nr:hypothetical protein [Clostridia bacterium]
MSSLRPLFKQPYFVTAHAVDRFRERVADLPRDDIINLIQASLQIKRPPLFCHRKRDGRLCWVYLCKYAGIPYAVPVAQNKHQEWPMVLSVLGPEEVRRDIEKRKIREDS